jgi:hypothetical protein
MKEVDKWIAQFPGLWESRFDNLDKALITLKAKKKRKK